MWVIYRVLISLYFNLIKMASWFRPDARKWIEGRKNFSKWLAEQNPNDSPHIWVHCSSLGEFEQGRSLIDNIKFKYPDKLIWLSFFSPSGYDVRKNYPQADVVSYFPSDNLNDVKEFIEKINPLLVIFVKYDFWFNTLQELSRRSVPFAFVSMSLHQNSYLRKSWANKFLNILREACLLSVQDQNSYDFLKSKGFDNILLAGDGRIDRIISLGEESFHNEFIDKFCGESPILVIGSSWTQDLEILKKAIQSSAFENWKIIIAPHKVDDPHINECKTFFGSGINLYSGGIQSLSEVSRVLVIDFIGLLATLYRKATLAYVGGGFGKGIHNILEPIAFGVPVCFGPQHKKFREAQIFMDQKFGFEIRKAEDLIKIALKCKEAGWQDERKVDIQQFLQNQKGSTERIMSYLEQHKFLK
ncbi:MAG: hypothetical protein IPG87_16890 [Saprospiraceae bacterium]|nr:hypothetical protein [Candidatus Vicinibacter affinis]MBK7303361.1 hypothetical protein [Candidatus Vicinibacter affinis]MBK8405928.1 hypothetical protein [Candidatus Vicinibacter affinis]